MLKILSCSFWVILALSVEVYGESPVELNCRIEPFVRIDISSAAEGIVSEILVDKNDSVKKGDVLAKLEASLESATVDLRKLQSELISDIETQELANDFAQRNLERVNNLYKKKAASFSQLDKVKTEKKLAQQQLQQAKDRKVQAELEYRRALADLNQRIIKSPIDGIVVERYKELGEHIYFEPVLQLVQLDPLKVEVFAPAVLYGKINVGMTTIVTPELAVDKKTYRAKVDKVDKIIDAPSSTFGVTLLIPNPRHHLPSGLKCKVLFPNVMKDSNLVD